ncbi:copper amine oxidase N-terminal domain-containing protein [Gracilibacillus oryzae]|uniref:Copper amine oxidase N-terminal domain-containing protein n=1 Tax=Gracilibacillus oryzae TaxID=1672701 RepID=A0A7C8GS00_9BACI|nr:copper amine oxidase N-terminal domain-containing protein [Gracilibacillus oryzae]KAB8128858.1 copper amine oxidase N-terminal domain-containing protein [Gracilibacillus oryzae]
MKMAKYAPLAITALLVGSTAVAGTTLAAAETPIEQEENQPVFIKTTGTVESVEERGDVSYYSVREGENVHTLAITADTPVYDNTGKKAELKKGDKVVAHTYSNKPSILIFPPQYSPEAVIVKTEEMGTAAVGSFDENLLDENLSLKLNISEETELLSVSGKEVEKTDLAEKDLLVFYTFTTRSIPAQTTPQKVIVLDQMETDEEGDGATNPVIDDIISNDFCEVDGTKMVPLRKLAESLGYRVEATETGAILSKGVHSYTLSQGEKAYGYNKSLRYFDEAPALLEPGKTYVPLQFIEELLNN